MEAIETVKHTPGRWMRAYRVRGGEPNFDIEAVGNGVVARSIYNEADARLIAEAPAMLGMLRAFVAAYEISFGKDNGACGGECNICQARAIINRIEGGTNQ